MLELMENDRSYATKGFALVLVFICLLFCLRVFHIDQDLPPWGVVTYQPIDEGQYAAPAINLQTFGVVNAQDALLLDGDLGLAGHRCLGSLIFASGSAMTRHQREALLEGTQELLAQAAPAVLSGVTAPNENMLVLRCASPVVEPVMMLWKTVWSFWRKELWGLQGGTPRIWSM